MEKRRVLDILEEGGMDGVAGGDMLQIDTLQSHGDGLIGGDFVFKIYPACCGRSG